MTDAVESFGSFEEMLDVMGARERAANDALTDTQRALRDDTTHDRHWLRLYPFHGDVLPIFGESWSLPHAMRRERAYYPDDIASDVFALAEYGSIVEGLHDRRARGYLYGECFSVVEPDGELGDTHASQVLPISPEAFAEARDGGWDLAGLDPVGLVWTEARAAAKAGS